ncbi:MAG TPA: UbiX family flavin prenyltransferase, partial [Candidatus Acidoferrum sp.]|nr:UbiX family flavin prenyltransferase [Candidatus Acidoferrum sp.]
RLIVGVSGASGAIYAQSFLRMVRADNEVEIHLIVTKPARAIIAHELGTKADISRLADYNYEPDDFMAPVCSGSFSAHGMIIIPCSMKTLAGLASGYTDNLLLRAADVTLKEKRRLLIVPREAPLGPVHLENMAKLSGWGAQIMPACPAFYHLPKSLDDLVGQFVFRIMDVFGLESPVKRWGDRLLE